MKAKVVDCDVDGRFCLTDEIGDPGRNVANLCGSLGRCGKWIGPLLLDCAEAILEGHGARDVVIGVLAGNDGARRFYERHGFRVTGELSIPRGGPTLWLMWRDPQEAGR